MRHNETPEGRSVRLLRVGEQVQLLALLQASSGPRRDSTMPQQPTIGGGLEIRY